MGGSGGHTSGAAGRRRNKNNNNNKAGQQRSKKERHNNTTNNDQNEKKKNFRWTSLLGVGSAVFVIGLAYLWENHTTTTTNIDTPADPNVETFWKKLCTTNVFCHPSLITRNGRTQKTSRNLPFGTTILKVPKQVTFWDLDALRNEEFVQRELFFRNNKNVKKRSGATYLAAYLAKLWKEVSVDKDASTTTTTTTTTMEDNDPNTQQPITLLSSTVSMPSIFNDWFRVLPTYDDFRQFHPVLWTEEELVERLGEETTAYQFVILWKEMYYDEYYDLSNSSTTFQSEISLERYLQARLVVTTRSLRVGHDEIQGPATPSREELQQFEQEAGVQLLRHGYHALVPGFDFFNHHPYQNGATYGWDAKSQSFLTTITAKPNVVSGSEILISYGLHHSDADLFARYGFVTGDGTHSTEISLAVHHHFMLVNRANLDDHKLGSQQLVRKIAMYLQYDDGYEHCVEKPKSNNNNNNDDVPNSDMMSVAWEFKKWKLSFLYQRCNTKAWMINLEPRVSREQLLKMDSTTKSVKDKKVLQPPAPPQFDMKFQKELLIGGKYQGLNQEAIISTCRAISAIHTDYDGQITRIFKENLSNRTFYLPLDQTRNNLNRALEYRTWNCVKRLATQALHRFDERGSSRSSSEIVTDQLERVSTLTRSNASWTVEHVRLAEMQSYELLVNLTSLHLKKSYQDILQLESSSRDPAFHIRDMSCWNSESSSGEDAMTTLVLETMR